MRFPLSLRIFLIHLIFTVGAAAVAVRLVRQTFESYEASWQREVENLPTELPLQPLVNEIATVFMTRLEDPVEERREAARERISEGLASFLKAIPAIQSLVIVDTDLRIRYASDKDALDLAYTKAEDRAFLNSDKEDRRLIEDATGKYSEVLWPIFDVTAGAGPGGSAKRLGSVLVRYRYGAELRTFKPLLRKPEPVSWKDLARVLVLFVVTIVGGGILVAALIALPVRRLDWALREFRARGFRGGLDVERLGLRGDLASTAEAISEMGGRLEILDAQGREREALLSTLWQSLEDGMLAVDPGGTPVVWNPAALRLLLPGAADPRAGRTTDCRVEEQELRGVLAGEPGLWTGGSPGSDVKVREVEIHRSDGSTVPVQVTEVPFEVRPGEMGTLLLLRDLAMLRKVELHLMEAGRFAVLAHLAAGLAHEIRNPLHSIGVNVDVVEEYVDSPPAEGSRNAMKESLAVIKDEAHRLGDLLNNYLGMLRPARALGPVDLREVCRRVVQLLGYSAIKSRVELRLVGDEHPSMIQGAADRLQQAILNLVLNAIQAMPEGGVATIETISSQDVVRVTVSDTGPGLPPDLEGNPFEPGVTTKPDGTGLGLPLVRMIVEAHGGSVWYRSDASKGASFTLVLPVAPRGSPDSDAGRQRQSS